MALTPSSGLCLAPAGADMTPSGAFCTRDSLSKTLVARSWFGTSAVSSHQSLTVAAHAAAAHSASTSLLTSFHRTPCLIPLSAETSRSLISSFPGSHHRHASSPSFRPHAATEDRLHDTALLTSSVRVATTARSAASSSSSSGSSSDSDPAPAPTAVQAAVEVLGPNSRRVSASIHVTAPLISVWSVLTDYHRLAEYVPSLAKNEVLELREGGARLLQVGEQDVAMGLKFQARVVVDVDEEPEQSVPVPGWTAGAPSAEASAAEMQGQEEEQRQAQASLLCRRAIRFIMREGDFAGFTGRWILESVRPGTSSAASAAMAPTRLSYSVDVTPHFWLPVALIEGRITREIGANLSSVALEALKRASYA